MKNAHFPIRIGGAVTAAICVTLLTACASTTPVLDANFGNAVRQARSAQTINPNASANRDPVLGIDGQAAASAQDRYQESFKSPPKTFEIINIGGAMTGE